MVLLVFLMTQLFAGFGDYANINLFLSNNDNSNYMF